jgi:hypothetical protein
LALFVKVFCDRLSCHGLQCGRTVPRNLSYFGHSVRVYGLHKEPAVPDTLISLKPRKEGELPRV